jgi:hypothetical protein
VEAVANVSNNMIPKYMQAWHANDDVKDTLCNSGKVFTLPSIFYGNLKSSNKADDFHSPVSGDNFNISVTDNHETTTNYSSNTLWAIIPSGDCFRPANATSHKGYFFPGVNNIFYNS